MTFPSCIPLILAAQRARRAICDLREGKGFIAAAYSACDRLEGVMRGYEHASGGISTLTRLHPRIVDLDAYRARPVACG